LEEAAYSFEDHTFISFSAFQDRFHQYNQVYDDLNASYQTLLKSDFISSLSGPFFLYRIYGDLNQLGESE